MQRKAGRLTADTEGRWPNFTVPLLDEMTALLQKYKSPEMQPIITSMAALNYAISTLVRYPNKDNSKSLQLLSHAEDIVQGAAFTLNRLPLEPEDRKQWEQLKPQIGPWLHEANKPLPVLRDEETPDVILPCPRDSHDGKLQKTLSQLLENQSLQYDKDRTYTIEKMFDHLLARLDKIQELKSDLNNPSHDYAPEAPHDAPPSLPSMTILSKTRDDIVLLRDTLKILAANGQESESRAGHITTTRPLATMSATLGNYLSLIKNVSRLQNCNLPIDSYPKDKAMLDEFMDICKGLGIGDTCHYYEH